MPAHLTPVRTLALLLALGCLTACSGSQDAPAEVAADTAAEPPMDTLVSVEWLQEHLDDPDLVVLDTSVLIEIGEDGSFKTVNGRAHYEQEHIPGAGFADLMGNLSALDSVERGQIYFLVVFLFQHKK